MRSFGKLLQIVGLAALPLGMLLQLLPSGEPGKPVLSLGAMLLVMVAGCCVFWIGRIVEGYARS
jgi:hypothetical protein